MSELAEDNARIEGAFRALFWRAEYAQRADSVDVVCCHANVIRYFVMRALQLPPEAWLRVSLTHASITLLQVRSSGPRHAPPDPNLAAAGAEQRPRHAPHARRLVGPAHRPHHACQRLTLLWALVGRERARAPSPLASSPRRARARARALSRGRGGAI